MICSTNRFKADFQAIQDMKELQEFWRIPDTRAIRVEKLPCPAFSCRKMGGTGVYQNEPAVNVTQ
jgi:hypothetical protein